MKRTLLSVLSLAGALVSCQPSEEVPPNLRGAEYFPLRVGLFYVYDVDSTHIVQDVESNFKFQLKVTVTDTYLNSVGDVTYVMQREKRLNAADTWTAAGTWSAWTDARKAVQLEGNERYIRLQFPIDAGMTWNGNAMNNRGGDDFCDDESCDLYEITTVEPFVTVSQSNEPDFVVKYDVRNESYARDIGLTYKEMNVLEYCTVDGCLGQQFVNEGIRYTQTLIEHGGI